MLKLRGLFSTVCRQSKHCLRCCHDAYVNHNWTHVTYTRDLYILNNSRLTQPAKHSGSPRILHNHLTVTKLHVKDTNCCIMLPNQGRQVTTITSYHNTGITLVWLADSESFHELQHGAVFTVLNIRLHCFVSHSCCGSPSAAMKARTLINTGLHQRLNPIFQTSHVCTCSKTTP